MSYRVRLGKFPKKHHEKYKNLTTDQIEEKYGEDDGSECLYFNYGSPEEFTEIEYIPGYLYNGKEKWLDFYDFKMNNLEYEFFIITKESLKEIIEQLSKEVYNLYNEVYEEFESDDGQSRALNIIYSKKCDWTTDFFNHLDYREDSLLVSRAESLEYVVLNLVNIYKLFNWEDDYLIFSGWWVVDYTRSTTVPSST